ncbi:MDR family MFS transporter [Kutzneria viridogrisea]|uniref:Drug resistance transporter, EmrB/QacA subfamily n=2 Tax=Kutzneria TaxID=43356 RepID=W5VYU8_9PSEU|nr:MDR family MFS transporter [Kutzneria albida]AHH93732.1 drug resistance transporter, EmrB/QacA subfamily [Kutzneria albida DSM 43870]MBA8931264.1 EmrB/QacA subfamily drug resistance transporter [Kutzneria viridogrisea]
MSQSAGNATPVAAGVGVGGFTHRQIISVISGLMLGMLLAALDQTIVASAMRTIADQLHGQTIQAWATTAYLITSTISTPLYGKLSDIVGRKPMYLTAISIFLVGSVLSGISTSMYELAAFRAVQGLGAGGLMSLAFAIVGDMVSPRERGKYQGYFLAVFGVSSVAGPVVGGFFAGLDNLLGFEGWRWVFLVNLPIGIIALAVVSRVLNLPHTPVKQRVDYFGALTLTIGVVPLLIVAEQGREWGWGSTDSVLMYVIGGLGIAAFLFVENKMGDAALLPLRMFRNGVFSLANVLNFIVGMGMFGGLAALPLYLQIVKGQTPTSAGLLTLPLMAGITIASLGSGQVIARTGRYKFMPIVGSAAMGVALLLFGQMTPDTGLLVCCLIMGLMGFGLGLCMQTLVLAIQNVVAPRDMGVATASATFFRSMGGTAGTAISLSILFGVVQDKIGTAFGNAAKTPEFQAATHDPKVLADPANAGFLKSLNGGGGTGIDLENTQFIEHLDARLARPVLEGFSQAIDLVFVVGSVVTAVAFVLVWFLKEVPLSSKSGMQRSADEEAEERTLMPVME